MVNATILDQIQIRLVGPPTLHKVGIGKGCQSVQTLLVLVGSCLELLLVYLPNMGARQKVVRNSKTYYTLT
jgi:hypothetical protein